MDLGPISDDFNGFEILVSSARWNTAIGGSQPRTKLNPATAGSKRPLERGAIGASEEVTEYFTLRPHVVGLRLLEVFTTFASATIKSRISRISSGTEEDARGSVSDHNFGILLKKTMLNLGPSFIKVGQSLSTRPDIIGYEVSKVYKARTVDRFDVAVKVQRPNLHHIVVRDIYILQIGLGLLQKIAKRKNGIRLYADELGKGLIEELDYYLEAANALEFMEVHSQFTFICSPKVFQHLTKKRVLTMEWMASDSPTELIFVSSEESNRKLLDLVNKGVEASLVQLLETGLMHADPHLRNLRYTSSGKIG
ncbi:Protein kinase superfamily protein [Perilla frutescens var. frutescens]|nr:Protein kinase superfamily protein [Perilla frutescens var. frutescens]